ncbi:hypothetical protein MTX25_09005 [Bradyrhizobium sp. ISRA432]|nr:MULTISPECIES: hypothetical protein [unclassified Bradyrhizobium]WGR72992.1 hypothetical protein MTX24_09000 [Bradyrhizobium sp. ISRA426]WGR77827.1 hypothetical protein MTX21_33955 [Bradyrhizobium sp. ISRA430]WGR88232.1 hypothetical protein MTX25_09005 [Bradyrhizobium sp. ISRA432]
MSWNHVSLTASARRLRWIACEPGFLLLVRVLPRLFLELLKNAFDGGKLLFFSDLQRLNEPKPFRRYLTPPPKPSGPSLPNRYIDMPDLREHKKFALHQVA